MFKIRMQIKGIYFILISKFWYIQKCFLDLLSTEGLPAVEEAKLQSA